LVTSIDVARQAGVSVSTVSYVVTGSRSVGKQTRRRVLDAIEATGYTPDAMARALRRSRSETIGLVVPDIRNPFFAAVIEGVEAEAQANDQVLLLINSAEDADREINALHVLRSRRVDGLIIGLTRRTPPAIFKDLRRDPGLPVVFIDRSGPPGFDQVTSADDVAATLMVRHLARLGHRRIAMIAGVRGISTAEERVAGYLAGLDAEGIPFDPALVVDGGSSRELARKAVTKLMSTQRPAALVVGSNDMTLGALEALQLLGIRIPADVALVSLVDFPYSHLLTPPITAVALPSFAMGREAIRLLLRRVRNRDAPIRSVRLFPDYVHRESCGCKPDEAGRPWL
jgi:LacI family transcriptional regulator